MYQSSQEPELPPQPYPIIPTISSDDNTSGGYHVIFKGSTFEKTKAKCSKCSRCSGYWGYKHLNGTYEGDCRNSDGHGHTCGHSPQCHGLREW